MTELKKIRTASKISQQKLSEKVGVSRSTIAMWETGGSQPDNDMLIRLSIFFNVSTDEILGLEKPKNRGIKIPVLGNVQAGIPIEAIEDYIDFEEIDEDMAAHGEHFGLVVKGDSMEPKFSPKDVVIVRSQPSVENGDIGIFLINGEDATIKKFNLHNDGSISLIPLNNFYEVLHYSAEEVTALPVTCLGRVVELRAKF